MVKRSAALLAACLLLTGCAPDSENSVTARMEKYYGIPFTETAQGRGKNTDIEVWALLDDNDLECRVERGLDEEKEEFVQRFYDDYLVMQQARTPAMQRLLAQEDFEVVYVSDIGQKMGYRSIYPVCGWAVLVDNYDDIADALQLVQDTLDDAESRLPMLETVRADDWRSILPTIWVENAHYRYALTAAQTFLLEGESRAIDMPGMLSDAQEKWKRCLANYGQPLPDAE